MITIIDYGLGNIKAFVNVYERLNIPILIAKTVDDLKAGKKIILPSLGWIDGTIKKFDASVLKSKTQLPHMGWNTIHPKNDNQLLLNLSNDSRFYFLHSYYFQ